MATVIRLGLSTIVGVIVTLGLFYLMQYLIQGADSALTEDKVGNLVDFVRVKQELNTALSFGGLTTPDSQVYACL